jgi:hypothetical protein
LDFKKCATKPFTASCGHRVDEGEGYVVSYNPHRRTKCEVCAGKEASILK